MNIIFDKIPLGHHAAYDVGKCYYVVGAYEDGKLIWIKRETPMRAWLPEMHNIPVSNLSVIDDMLFETAIIAVLPQVRLLNYRMDVVDIAIGFFNILPETDFQETDRPYSFLVEQLKKINLLHQSFSI